MKLKLRVWCQADPDSRDVIAGYDIGGVPPDMSLLEILDMPNEQLTDANQGPVAFDHNYREDICGICGLAINGVVHGGSATTTCQLHVHSFADGATIKIEPWRAEALPIIEDLAANRMALDRIIQSGGYVSFNTGSAPDAHVTPTPKRESDRAFDNATCIDCDAYVAAYPDSPAVLFMSAKIAHLAMLPQGQPERYRRVKSMIAQHDQRGLSNCTNIGEYVAVCPEGTSLESTSQLNHDLTKSLFKDDGKQKIRLLRVDNSSHPGGTSRKDAPLRFKETLYHRGFLQHNCWLLPDRIACPSPGSCHRRIARGAV